MSVRASMSLPSIGLDSVRFRLMVPISMPSNVDLLQSRNHVSMWKDSKFIGFAGELCSVLAIVRVRWNGLFGGSGRRFADVRATCERVKRFRRSEPQD